MKKIYSILTVCLTCLIMPVFTGCIEQAELVEDLELSACLTPSSTSMSIDRADGTTVTFTWANSRGASRYEIQIFEGDEMDLPERSVMTVVLNLPINGLHSLLLSRLTS